MRRGGIAFLIAALGWAQACLAAELRPVVDLWPAGTAQVDASISEEIVPRHFEIVKNIHNPNLTVFRPEQPNGMAVVICPGGAYVFLATGLEGYPVAEKLNEAGITAFVLKSRLPTTEGVDFKHPVPLSDALRAIQWVRAHAAEYQLDPNRIGIMGFSAGGHLAATAGTLYAKYNFGTDAISQLSARPDFVCLGYPVISTQEGIAHGCVWSPLKAGFTEEDANEMSCELNVNAQTPPTFLMHAKDDGGVLPENSIVMHEALKQHGVATELKLYEKGGHGFGLGRAGTDSIQWSDACIDWLSQLNAKPKPNIVHIMIDDLGWQDIASHKIDGKPVYETPHLDQLTLDGRRFTQAYSPAPSCAPSRVAFLRGQHVVNTGVYHVSGGRIPRPWSPDSARVAPYYLYGLPVEEPMIPEALSKAGYISGHVGKWHAGGKSAGYPFPLDQGFDFGFTERDGRHKYYNDPELWRASDGAKNQFFGTWGGMKPDRLSAFATEDSSDPYRLNEEGRPFDKPHDLALGFMEQNKDQSFFLNYCPYYVHGPIQTRNRERLEHYVKKLGYAFPTDPKQTYYDLPGHSDPYYASMVDEVDWMVGDIVRYLEATDDPRNPGHKLIDNTYLIVDSDNGGVRRFTDNQPLKGFKQNTWEGGIRIPFLVRGPGIEAGSICETPINLIDLFPTFMEIAGMDSDPSLELDGGNLLPLFHGESDQVVMADGAVRESLFWYFPWDAHMSSAIRQGDWKLVRGYGAWMGDNAAADVKLYRLYQDGAPNDIGETQDLSRQYPEIRNRLLAELDGRIEAAGQPVPHQNATGQGVAPELLAQMPSVLELGSDQDQVWVTLESGQDKAEIADAQLLYTLNPPQMDTVKGHREEWLPAPATIHQGRVEATMPPGATHAVFSMVDRNGFLITSEPMPAATDVGHHVLDSKLVEDGFAYKPGLYALIQLGEAAKAAADDTAALSVALAAAKTAHAADGLSGDVYCDAIRDLRGAIRNQKGAPQAQHPLINRFPTDPLF